MAKGRLGCLDTIEAIITDQCGGPRICALTNLASVSFNRVLDDISEAVVVVPLGSGVSNTKPCCDCLDQIEPWCHELHIIRNGEEVWTGPVNKVTYGFTQVTIQALDVLSWLLVRVPQGVINNSVATTSLQSGTVDISTLKGNETLAIGDASNFFLASSTQSGTVTISTTSGTPPVTTTVATLTYTGISGNTLTGVNSNGSTGTISTGMTVTGLSNGDEITDLGLQILNTAFDEHDPCVLDYVLQTDLDYRPTIYANTVVSSENFPAFEGTVYDWLTNLSELGLDFTVIGRRILLGVTQFNLPRLGTLVDEHILGEIEVAKDGNNMGNRVFVRYEQDTDAAQCLAQNPDIPAPPCPSISEAGSVVGTEDNDINSICYGPIERVFTDALSFNYTTAKQTGDSYVVNGQIAPRILTFPSGTKLSPDTPWTLNEMIPGTKVAVDIRNLCLDLHQDMRILEINYSLQVGGDEEISMSLNIFNEVGQI